MPHYSDGQLAQVGDIVKGKGYNIKNENNQLKEIVGLVSNISPETSSCNIQIQLFEPISASQIAEEANVNKGFINRYGLILIGNKFFQVKTEYGQCDHFIKIN